MEIESANVDFKGLSSLKHIENNRRPELDEADSQTDFENCKTEPLDDDVDVKPDIVNLDELPYILPLEATSSNNLEEENKSTPLGINFDEKKNFACPVCPYRTKIKCNLVRHSKVHDKDEAVEKKFKCNQCPYESCYKSGLAKHEVVHSNNYLKCEDCDFVTKHKDNLQKHSLKHKSPQQCKIYICDECDYESKDRAALKRHEIIHKRLEEVEHFKCTICNFVTKHQISLNNHVLKIHHRDKIEKYKCDECDFSTYHKISIKSHILTHRKPGEVPMFKCPECPYETKNKQFLPNHMKSHLDYVPCPKCKKMISPRGMSIHLRSHEAGEAKKRYRCKQCDYGTLYYGNLSRHVKIMHSQKTDSDYRKCPDCPFKTFENARLKRHIKEIHSEEAPEYKCDHCKFTSKFNSCLKRHVETAHINTDPVECPVCHKQSANIYTLRIHMKIHKREDEVKIFQCAICPYKSRHSGAFKEHMIRHKPSSEITYFQCSNCPFKTITKNLMNEHIRKYSDTTKASNKFSCPKCCFRASREGNIKIHMAKKHTDDIDPDELQHCKKCKYKTFSMKKMREHQSAHRKDSGNSKQADNESTLSLEESSVNAIVKCEDDVSDTDLGKPVS